MPKIVEVKPTNLPAVAADELRLDKLIYLTDGRVAFVDYESSYSGGFRSFSMELTAVFLIEQDSSAIWISLKEKTENGNHLSDEDLMRMVIYPFTFKGEGSRGLF